MIIILVDYVEFYFIAIFERGELLIQWFVELIGFIKYLM